MDSKLSTSLLLPSSSYKVLMELNFLPIKQRYSLIFPFY